MAEPARHYNLYHILEEDKNNYPMPRHKAEAILQAILRHIPKPKPP